MANTLKLPVGIENFEEIRKLGFYYIDKTRLIEQLLKGWGKVTLFTRPRRFGKTLNMSMLRSFFEIGTDKSLFDGLYISGNKVLCDEHMGKYPVIFLSFKGVEGLTYDEAFDALVRVIGKEISRVSFLADSDKLTMLEREQYKGLTIIEDGSFVFSKDKLISSLQLLSQLLYKHYGQKVVILIDEYDVPLDKAFQNGYYKEMVSLIRGLFGQALKTNEFLQFAVLTGCLRVSKESIFTGLNNFEINSIVDIDHDEQFGFTDDEVMKLLYDYDRSERYPDVKEWYDGYHFGNADIYCPWDVLNYIQKVMATGTQEPENFWEHTSDNSVIRTFLERTDFDVTEKFETLLNGGTISEAIEENLTYNVLTSSEQNLWSLLYLTGYLTKVGSTHNLSETLLKIPNHEVMSIFQKSVTEWFSDSLARSNRSSLFEALWNEDADKLTEILSDLLFNTISYHDYAESFYHAFVAGLFANAGYIVESNYENGLGRSDLVIKDRKLRRVIVIELKIAKNKDCLADECYKALQQIEEKKYATKIEQDGFKKVIRYGIAFYKKECLVM